MNSRQIVARRRGANAETVVVAIAEFEGCNLIEIRTWANRELTPKSISLPLDRLPWMIESLLKAGDEAVRRGLLLESEC
jgi:hypothetical protein